MSPGLLYGTKYKSGEVWTFGRTNRGSVVNGFMCLNFVGNLRAHSLFLDLRTFAPSPQASEDRYVTPLLGLSDLAALSPLMDTSLRVLNLRGTAPPWSFNPVFTGISDACPQLELLSLVQVEPKTRAPALAYFDIILRSLDYGVVGSQFLLPR